MAKNTIVVVLVHIGAVLCRGVAGEDIGGMVSTGRFAEASEALAARVASSPESASALSGAVASGFAAWRATLGEIVALGVREVSTPAFRWAQNDTAIFLEVKFSPTLSAPASTDAAVDSVQLSDRRLELAASAPARGKRWDLALRFWGVVDDTTQKTVEASAGRATLTVPKRTAFRWPRLQACDVPAPANAGLWLDMQEAHGFSEDNDDDDDDDGGCQSLEAKIHAAAAAEKKGTATRTTTKKTTEKKKKTTSSTTGGPTAKTSKTTTTTKAKATTTTKSVDDAVRDEVKALKKKAGVARKAITDNAAKAKKRVESYGKAQVRRIREDAEARQAFVTSSETPLWAASLPPRVAIRDGVWDVFLLVSTAHRRGATDALRRRAADSRASAVTTVVIVLAALVLLRRRLLLLRLAALGVLAAAIFVILASGLVLRAIDGFLADLAV